jgi:hypothetical protein
MVEQQLFCHLDRATLSVGCGPIAKAASPVPLLRDANPKIYLLSSILHDFQVGTLGVLGGGPSIVKRLGWVVVEPGAVHLSAFDWGEGGISHTLSSSTLSPS